MNDQSMYIHLLAGGLAGSAGTVLTCPLEVIKTRLQASTSSYQRITLIQSQSQQQYQPQNNLNINNTHSIQNSQHTQLHNNLPNANKTHFGYKLSSNSITLFKNTNCLGSSCTTNGINFVNTINTSSKSLQPRLGMNIYVHLRFILENEGYRALFKGLTPTLVGVAPYRAIYFYSYASSKKIFANKFGHESSLLHAFSAFVAGFCSVSVTNPIWFVKTRLQLDETRGGISIAQVAKKILREKGFLGFYKGISASYFGIVETAIYFSIYEKLKTLASQELNDSQTSYKYISLFGSAGFSKSLASCMCYPHEVARTRLREEGNKYTGFFQTLMVVYREEGYRGLYKGMGTHLIRQIPNSMIVMVTYEMMINYFRQCQNVVDE